MEFTEALRTFVRLLEATADRPFGLLSILAFVSSVLAYLLLRDVSPRLSGRLMWLVLASLVAVGVAVSETQQRSPALRQITIGRGTVPPPAASPGPSSPAAPARSGRITTGTSSTSSGPAPAATARTASGGSSGTTAGSQSSGGGSPQTATGQSAGSSSAASAPGSATGASRPGGGGPAGSGAAGSTDAPAGGGTFVFGTRDPAAPDEPSPARNTWVVAGPLSRELTTRDHRESPRTTYSLRLEVGDDDRLVRPQLECLGGPCTSSIVQDPRVSADGRSVEAWFDVWDAPTRWRLTAVRERFSRVP